MHVHAMPVKLWVSIHLCLPKGAEHIQHSQSSCAVASGIYPLSVSGLCTVLGMHAQVCAVDLVDFCRISCSVKNGLLIELQAAKLQWWLAQGHQGSKRGTSTPWTCCPACRSYCPSWKRHSCSARTSPTCLPTVTCTLCGYGPGLSPPIFCLQSCCLSACLLNWDNARALLALGCCVSNISEIDFLS